MQAEKTSNQQRTMTRNLKYEVNFLFKKKGEKILKKAQLRKVMPQGQEMVTGGQPVECVCALLCFPLCGEKDCGISFLQFLVRFEQLQELTPKGPALGSLGKRPQLILDTLVSRRGKTSVPSAPRAPGMEFTRCGQLKPSSATAKNTGPTVV